MRRYQYWNMVAGTLLIVLCAQAQESGMSEALEACVAETDDTRRLACFDAAMSPESAESAGTSPDPAAAAAAATVAVAASSAPEAAETTVAAAPESVPAAPPAAQATAAPETAAAPDAAATTTAVDVFGRVGEDEDALKEISATVVEVSKRLYGEVVVTLDNGQVWVEKDATFGFRIEVGDEAVIKKGSFGGFKLMGRGRRSTPVRRVE